MQPQRFGGTGRNWRLQIAFAALLSLLLLVGCGGGIQQRDRTATLQVENLSDFTICDVHLAPRGQRDWGTDQLGLEEAIGPDDARAFPVNAGRLAVRLNDCRGRVMFVKRNLDIRGTRRLTFRPVEVQRDPRFGQRRFAAQPRPVQPL